MNHNTAATTWQTTLGQLQLRMTPANFETWLRDTVGLRHDHDGFVVGAPNELAREWLGVRLNMPIQGVPKLVKIACRSQFKQTNAAVRRHADLSAAHGMRLSSTPSQANPLHVPDQSA